MLPTKGYIILQSQRMSLYAQNKISTGIYIQPMVIIFFQEIVFVWTRYELKQGKTCTNRLPSLFVHICKVNFITRDGNRIKFYKPLLVYLSDRVTGLTKGWATYAISYKIVYSKLYKLRHSYFFNFITLQHIVKINKFISQSSQSWVESPILHS